MTNQKCRYEPECRRLGIKESYGCEGVEACISGKITPYQTFEEANRIAEKESELNKIIEIIETKEGK